jgi:hypothetical protein
VPSVFTDPDAGWCSEMNPTAEYMEDQSHQGENQTVSSLVDPSSAGAASFTPSVQPSNGVSLLPITATEAAVLRKGGERACTPCLTSGQPCHLAFADFNPSSGQVNYIKTIYGNPMCRTCQTRSYAPNSCDSRYTMSQQ